MASRQHRQREAQEAVAAHLQQHAGQDHRARRRRLDMRVGQPGMDRPHRHLDRERGEEGQPQPVLHAGREAACAQQHRRMSVVPACEIDREDRQQHQHRAEQRVEEELEGRVDAPRAAPDADDQEHRDQHALEEDVEQRRNRGRRTCRPSTSRGRGRRSCIP